MRMVFFCPPASGRITRNIEVVQPDESAGVFQIRTSQLPTVLW